MGKEKFASGLLSQSAPPSFGSGKGVGGCARGLGFGILLLFCFWSALLLPLLPVAVRLFAGPPLPPTPVHRSIVHHSGRARPVQPAQQVVSAVVFWYPTGVCTISWTIQGSSNLINWVDLQTCALGCPSGDLEVGATNGPCYFYRLKGTP